MKRHRVLVTLVLVGASILTGCQTSPSYQQPAGSKADSLAQNPGNSSGAATKLSLRTQFEREHPEFKALQTMEGDLNKDATPELFVEAEEISTGKRFIGLWSPGLGLKRLTDVSDFPGNTAEFHLFNYPSESHVVLINQFGGHQYLVYVWGFDGESAKQLLRTEADDWATVEDQTIISVRRTYKLAGGFDRNTAKLTWNPKTRAYEVASRQSGG